MSTVFLKSVKIAMAEMYFLNPNIVDISAFFYV